MTSAARRYVAGTLLAIGVLVFSWSATGARSFLSLAYVLLAVPSVVAPLLYVSLGGFSANRSDVTNYCRLRSSRAATIAWIALLVVSFFTELRSRRARHHVASLSQTGAWVARHVFGRAILWLLWLFVGLHLFARYGVQH